MTNLSPITLFVYNRPWHTQRTIEALRANELAGQSDLIIFADGAKSEKDLPQVEAVRNYIKTISGFKSVKIHEKAQNCGLANSIIAGVTQVVNNYGSIIVLEDDMVTSQYFLRYMNDALEMYKNEEKVISIHGYTLPVKEELPQTFFLYGADCWGWATWKRGWNLFEHDGRNLLKKIDLLSSRHQFDMDGHFPYRKMLKDQIAGKISSWAIRWYASAFLEKKLTLYFGKSLIKNIGCDNSGEHCSSRSKHLGNAELCDRKTEIKKISAQVNIKIYELMSKAKGKLKIPLWLRSVQKIKLIIKNYISHK
ncbi:glycosyltransferase family 2 protein [Lentisphaerota bacterium ZTH]|nr:glycosyltransferase family 2 protein [Lentisphaerota bacterium ZTH]